MKDNIKALILGSLAVFLVSWLALWTMETLEIAYLSYFTWGAPAIGSFITAITAKSKKLTLALLLAMPAAIIYGIENYLWQLVGKGSDFPGFKGFVTLVTIEFILSIILCSIGGSLGYFITRQKLQTGQQDARH